MDIEEIWVNITAKVPESEKWWAKINEAYSSNERFYHNMQHIQRKFSLLKEVFPSHANKPALIYAILFQYFKYDPKETEDTTSKNLSEFKKFAEDIKLDADISSEVESLLMMEFCGREQEIMQDLDMSSLGVDSDQYKQLTDKLRKEYSHMSDDSYKTRRKKLLQSFLLIPSIFSTDELRTKFESQARSNIENEVSQF